MFLSDRKQFIMNPNNHKIKLTQNGIVYLLNDDENTASVKRIDGHGNIIIPRMITYRSKNYIITTICSHALSSLEIYSVEFPEDSGLLTIETNAFYICPFTTFSIPASVSKLQESWILNGHYLKEIKVSPNNPHFKSYENKFILGKSNKAKENFDILIFSIFDIKNVIIPDFIEIIGAKSFYNHEAVKSIQFSENSKLRIIEKDAFSSTSIESITIPANVEKIKGGWSNSMNVIDIDPKNKNFKYYDNNKMIIGKSRKEQENYDVLIWCDRNIKKVTIPEFIKKIGSYSFNGCKELEEVLIPNKSQLQNIGKYSFCDTHIKTIRIPPQLTKIGKSAFNTYYQDFHIEFPSNSELQDIGEYAFSGTFIESIIIPPKITKIKYYTFGLCSKFNLIQFSENSNLQEIEEDAFLSTKVDTLTLPNFIELKNFIKNIKIDSKSKSLKYFDDDNKIIIAKSSTDKENFDVLFKCTDCVDIIKIPDFIERIGAYCFYTQKITKVEISSNSNLKIIDSYAFNSSSIESISFPPDLICIKSYAFQNCNKLKQVEIPIDSNLQIIEKNAFESTLIESIFIPSKVVIIKDYLFKSCKNLQIINFHPNSNLKTIKFAPFIGSGIQKLTIPSTVNEMAKNCLSSSNLKQIDVDPNNQYYKSYENKVIFTKSSIENEVFDVLAYSLYNIKKIKIPDSIEIIDSYVFKNCKIKKIEFSKNSKLRIINEHAFDNSSINSISFPSKLKEIKMSAFLNCSNLETVEIPENSELEIIEENAFNGTSIESIYIPPQITQINEGIFDNCEELKTIEIPKNSKLKIINSSYFNKTKIERFTITENVEKIKGNFLNSMNVIDIDPKNKNFKYYDNNKMIIGKSRKEQENYDVLIWCDRNIKKVTIPEFIKKIGSYSFNGCKELEEVLIPNKSQLQSIGKYSFFYTHIKTIRIPPQLTKIGKNAFNECKQLYQVKIPKNSQLQEIKHSAFKNASIEYIFIPPKVKQIHPFAFSDCKKLQYVKIPSNSQLEIIGKRSFENTSIESISIPSSVIIIDEECFTHCRRLEQIDIPMNSNLLSIGEHCFDRCSIEGIKIPSKIKKFNTGIFRDNYNLKYVEFLGDSQLKHIDSYVFCNSSIYCFSMPPKFCYLPNDIFGNTKIKLIEINDYSNLQDFNINYLPKNREVIVLISINVVGRFDLNLGSENQEQLPTQKNYSVNSEKDYSDDIDSGSLDLADIFG